MQRYFDIIFSVFWLIMLSPLLLLVVVLLRFSAEGEVFFFQERVGYKGRIFQLCKFATMLKNSPNLSTGTITTKNDFRILPFGRILRKTKINEIPQLFNILCGDMSFIGPRPLTTEVFKLYSKKTQEAINETHPGLSGIGSIIFRNEEEILSSEDAGLELYRSIIAPYKGCLESWYFEHRNLKVYFILILLTIWVVIFPKSGIVWRIFPDLPAPPSILKIKLNYIL